MADGTADGREEPARTLGEAQAGDLGAFERLMGLYERRVFLVAVRLLGNSADAQDAAQEVFLRLYRHLRRMDRDPGPWIYRVTVNVCRDMARRRLPSAAPAEAAAAQAPAEEGMALAERLGLVERALRTLPERQRAALVLRDVEGLTTRETASVLGTTEATVRSHVSAARLRIKGFVEAMLRRRS